MDDEFDDFQAADDFDEFQTASQDFNDFQGNNIIFASNNQSQRIPSSTAPIENDLILLDDNFGVSSTNNSVTKMTTSKPDFSVFDDLLSESNSYDQANTTTTPVIDLPTSNVIISTVENSQKIDTVPLHSQAEVREAVDDWDEFVSPEETKLVVEPDLIAFEDSFDPVSIEPPSSQDGNDTFQGSSLFTVQKSLSLAGNSSGDLLSEFSEFTIATKTIESDNININSSSGSSLKNSSGSHDDILSLFGAGTTGATSSTSLSTPAPAQPLTPISLRPLPSIGSTSSNTLPPGITTPPTSPGPISSSLRINAHTNKNKNNNNNDNDDDDDDDFDDFQSPSTTPTSSTTTTTSNSNSINIESDDLLSLAQKLADSFYYGSIFNLIL